MLRIVYVPDSDQPVFVLNLLMLRTVPEPLRGATAACGRGARAVGPASPPAPARLAAAAAVEEEEQAGLLGSESESSSSGGGGGGGGGSVGSAQGGVSMYRSRHGLQLQSLWIIPNAAAS